MEGNKESEHVLVLKVMRLTRPSFQSTLPTYSSEHRNAFNQAFDQFTISQGFTERSEFCSVDQALILPQTTGVIFLGEVFTSHININNDSEHVCTNINLKIELQTPSKRIPISSIGAGSSGSGGGGSGGGGGGGSRDELKPGSGLNEIIQHEVKELGAHILVCTVTYYSSFNEKASYRKFFKFNVHKPLDVKTKFYHTDQGDCLYLEAQIQNITNHPIHLEKVSLETDDNLCVTSLNDFENDGGGDDDTSCSSDDDDVDNINNNNNDNINNNDNNKNNNEDDKNTKLQKSPTKITNIFHPLLYLQNQDTRQYLYKLTTNNNNNNKENCNSIINGGDNNNNNNNLCTSFPFLSKEVSDIGKLDIVWKSLMGERGRLQTSQLKKMFPGSGDLNLRVMECRGEVYEGVLDKIALCVTNCSDRSMDLSMKLHNDHHKGFHWSGISCRHLGIVDSNACINLHLEFVTNHTGLISLSGLHLTDQHLKRTYEHDDFVQVLSNQWVVGQ